MPWKIRIHYPYRCPRGRSALRVESPRLYRNEHQRHLQPPRGCARRRSRPVSAGVEFLGLWPRAQGGFFGGSAASQTLSPYAATKLAAEHLCGNYSHLYDLPVVVMRFFTVYGPAQRPDLAIHKFTDRIYYGKPIQQYGDGSTRRDSATWMISFRGSLALSVQQEPFAVFNLGENQTTTLSDLIIAIENALGKRAIIECLPEQQGDMPLTCANIDKARALLGYHPKVKISEGIPKFVDWCLERRR